MALAQRDGAVPFLPHPLPLPALSRCLFASIPFAIVPRHANVSLLSNYEARVLSSYFHSIMFSDQRYGLLGMQSVCQWESSTSITPIIIGSNTKRLLLNIVAVVPPWDWTPGKVKTSVYTIGKKGVHDDTPTEIYSGVQSASRP